MANGNQNMDLQQFGRVTAQTNTTYSNNPQNSVDVVGGGGLWSNIKSAFSMSTDNGSDSGYFGNAGVQESGPGLAVVGEWLATLGGLFLLFYLIGVAFATFNQGGGNPFMSGGHTTFGKIALLLFFGGAFVGSL